MDARHKLLATRFVLRHSSFVTEPLATSYQPSSTVQSPRPPALADHLIALIVGGQSILNKELKEDIVVLGSIAGRRSDCAEGRVIDRHCRAMQDHLTFAAAIVL